MMQYAQTLKNSSGYIGASHLHYECFYIQDYFLKKEEFSMKLRYKRLIENVIEFINYSKDFMLNNQEDQ